MIKWEIFYPLILVSFSDEVLTVVDILRYLIDPKDIVLGYLSDNRVISKNTNNQDFANSTRVFVDLQQTRLETDGSRPGSQIMFEQLQVRFQDFCMRYDQHKQSQIRGAQPR